MLLNYKNEILSITREFDEKTIKKLGIKSLVNLSEKLQDKENDDISTQMYELKEILNDISAGAISDKRKFRKAFSIVRKLVQDEFDYHQKDSIKEKYIGIGIAIGVAIGAGLSSIMASYIGVGIALGVAIGAGIGTQKEKEAFEAGKIY